jgi:1,2-phenylacetyl-CoA epoxidase catalytic subunit
MKTPPFDLESLALLKRIVEGQAYRQLMLAHIRGHGIRFLPDLENKVAMAKAVDTSLQQFRELVRLYRSLGFGDLLPAIRSKLERVPYPGSQVELGLCLFLCERANHIALQAYSQSTCKDLAAAALTRLEESKAGEMPDDPIFLEYCREAAHRPHAQQLLTNWLSITLLSLGRPNSPGDARAVALGLRSRPVADIAREFIAGLRPFLAASGLAFPSEKSLGVELPALATAPQPQRTRSSAEAS